MTGLIYGAKKLPKGTERIDPIAAYSCMPLVAFIVFVGV